MMLRLSFLVFCLLILLSGCSSPSPIPAPDMRQLEYDIAERVAAYDSARVSVSIIDPAHGIEWHLGGDDLYHAASTMKVPVLIEMFRQADAGRFSMDDSLLLKNEFRSIVDGSLYSIEDDSDDAIYEQLGNPMSLRQLAYNMTTVSSNLATNLLIDFLSADSVQATSERLGTQRMQTIRGVEDLKAFDLGMSNRATSRDLALLMEHIRAGTAVSENYDAEMRTILMDQVFNSMIPNGLPEGTQVAHKTGSITAIHHDAAIVYPKEGDAYVLIIMTGGILDHEASSELGSDITTLVHQTLRGTS
ncbi:MAG: class A beta-lactamase-related serine hydrolase [Bacteroidetes bacterium]|nr:class A beta-lactamase-related serine hydrolase [Bacteroidota bacterium]MDA1332615.1 class A beta-lactamase-related serine hydrolase [Bacteroidota bacterium]